MNEQNLIPFKPGVSGNPNGKPVGSKWGLRAHLNHILRKRLPGNVIDMLKAKGLELDDKTYAEVIAYVLAVKAAEGDLAAARLVADQTEVPTNKEGIAGMLDLDGGPVKNSWTIEIKDADNPSS